MRSKRRSIGAAFERSPSEKIKEWATRNSLSLIASLIISSIFWAVANVAIDKFFNFLANNGETNVVRKFDSDDPEWVAAKIIGSIICVLVICKRTTR